jgi:hypothetical protein
MRTIPEYKRAKQTGRGKAPPHLGIPHWIIKREEFAAIKGGPLKLLIDLAALYNGYNNGNLSIAEIRHRWRSRSKTTRAEQALLRDGWIIKTKFGGLGIGPDLFAVTWWPVDSCKGKHDYPVESLPSHMWMKTRHPDPKQVRAVPEAGTGNVLESTRIGAAVPETGMRTAVFKAA